MTVTSSIEPTTPTLTRDEEPQERPRYAAQRMMAAHMGRLPQRIVVRAHSEGLAHRRAEETSDE